MYVFTLYLSNCVQKPYHLRISILVIEMKDENPVFSPVLIFHEIAIKPFILL